MKNGRHSKVEHCRQVTITKFNMQRERGGVRRGRRGGGGVRGEKERERERGGARTGWGKVANSLALPRRSPNNQELKHLRTRVQWILLPAMIRMRNL